MALWRYLQQKAASEDYPKHLGIGRQMECLAAGRVGKVLYGSNKETTYVERLYGLHREQKDCCCFIKLYEAQSYVRKALHGR